MHALEVTIRETLPDGRNRIATRWAHTGPKGQWVSATAGGRDYREHQSQEAARAALAGWLRSQALILAPDDRVIEPEPTVDPLNLAAPDGDFLASEVRDSPPATAAGLEDLL